MKRVKNYLGTFPLIQNRPLQFFSMIFFGLMLIMGIYIINNSNNNNQANIASTTEFSVSLPEFTQPTDAPTTTKVKSIPVKNGTYYQYTGATIYHSFYRAGKKAGLNYHQIHQLAQMFGETVRPGDHFSVLYQTTYKNDKKISKGNIVAAEFTDNHGQTRHVFRYTDPHGHAGYYTLNGQNIKPAFLKYPVKFTRISSRFSLHRYHPILHRYRAHLGVDLAAPMGTPIHAASDGVIILAGRDHGYGNAVFIKHSYKLSTRYGHMHRIAKGIHIGTHVHKGQVIGYVGKSGLATGPHLHYEVRVFGIARNPLTVKLPHAKAITKKQLPAFKRHARHLMAQLQAEQQHSWA